MCVHEWLEIKAKGEMTLCYRWHWSVKQDTNTTTFNLQMICSRLLVERFTGIFQPPKIIPNNLKPARHKLFLNSLCGFLIIRIEVSLSHETGSQVYLITSAGIPSSPPPRSVRQNRGVRHLSDSQSERSGWVSCSDIVASNYPWPRASSVLKNLNHTADNGSLNQPQPAHQIKLL